MFLCVIIYMFQIEIGITIPTVMVTCIVRTNINAGNTSATIPLILIFIDIQRTINQFRYHLIAYTFPVVNTDIA